MPPQLPSRLERMTNSSSFRKAGTDSGMVKLGPQIQSRKEKARLRGKGEVRTRGELWLCRRRIVPWTRDCVLSVVMRIYRQMMTMEVKEATLVAVAMVADLEEDLGHPEGQVVKELPDRLEDQVEDPLGRLKAGLLGALVDHRGDLVDHPSKVRLCTILDRTACSTSRRRLGIWPRNREWRSKSTMSEEA